MTVASAAACAFETAGLSRPRRNQRAGNPAYPVATPRIGVSGINTSASYQAKRGGMIPINVRAVPFSTKVLFSTPGSPLKRLIQVLCRITNTGGAPGW